MATISVYLYITGKNYLVSLIPGVFYFFVTLSFIFHAPIGLNLDKLVGMEGSYTASYALAALFCVGYVLFVRKHSATQKDQILNNVIS